MKLLDIIWKEISLVKSQKVALLLIILYPFLVIGVLGSSFTGIDLTKTQNVSVVILNDLPFDSNLAGQVSSMPDVHMIEVQDENELLTAIKSKEALVGLKISGASESSQIRVDLFYDNSNLLSSRFFMELAKAMFQKVTIEMTRAKMANIVEALNSLGGSVDDQTAQLTTFRNKVDSISASFERLQNSLTTADLNTIENGIDSILGILEDDPVATAAILEESSMSKNELTTKLVAAKASIKDARVLLAQGESFQTEIKPQLDTSFDILETLSGQMEGFGVVDPRVLAQPVVFYERKVFDADPFGILVSNAAVVVLALTCLLLTAIIVILERTENVALRLSLAPTSSMLLVFGKIIGQLCIALIEAAIIFTVAFAKISFTLPMLGEIQLGFGLSLSVPLLDVALAIILISLTFICIGLVIAAFSKSQSTAILVSLLIIVPMLFLSGIVIPIEFMDPTMQIISSFLPLTVANNLLIGLFVKGFSIAQLWFECAVLIGCSILSLLIVSLKK